jgi:hypothetical protein
MNGASAEYVTRTEPSFDAPRVTMMLVQARTSPGPAVSEASKAGIIDRRRSHLMEWLLRVIPGRGIVGKG